MKKKRFKKLPRKHGITTVPETFTIEKNNLNQYL